jgi:soluble lytic murein transglycosylase
MLKQLQTKKTPLIVGSGLLLVALLGSVWLTPRVISWLQAWTHRESIADKILQEDPDRASTVLTLVALPRDQRQAQLKALAAAEKPSLERSRARYLLAADYIQKFEGGAALRQLEGLEQEYPVMVPQILLKRGRAYELTNETEKAQETWQTLLKTYPNSPVAVEALYYLGKYHPQYWEQAIAQFPQHPRTQEIIRDRLQENPKQPQLLLLLARYAPEAPGSNTIRDRLVKEYSSQLKPADWEMIARGYWQQQDYPKAVQAYAKATHTPETFYRLARGLQIQGKKEQAIAAYQKLIAAFPKAEETGLALRRLASLSPPQEAIAYLDRAIAQFPKEAPQALVEKAKRLEGLNSKASAAKALQTLLTQYAQSDTAAEYRWKVAKKWADKGDRVKAWQWAQPITQNNPDSNLAPKAAFWVGKWAQQLSRQQDAKTAFEHVIGRYPQSYYAWRSAVHLGWNVGDFTNVRQMSPAVIKPDTRFTPPAGSDLFKELYRLGEDADALRLFQAEIGDRKELTVAEVFTQSLFKLKQGKNLQAINQILALKDRDEPQDKQQWQSLRQTPQYWYVLFPFPFEETILDWSRQRQLNPLLVTSLIRQESRFEPEIRSPVGAVGLMQVMPATGQWVADKINLNKYSLTNPNDNVNLGTWYLDHTHQEYDNNSLLAVASYNAGPGNVAQWIQKYGLDDSDTFVEKIPFNETKGYVESVFGNYWNYLRLYNPDISRLFSQFTGR